MNRKAKITEILNENFDLYKCIVSDVSELHRGHSGFIEGEQTHFKITIISNDFENKNILKRHRMVNNCLKSQFEGSLHSITFRLLTISESENH